MVNWKYRFGTLFLFLVVSFSIFGQPDIRVGISMGSVVPLGEFKSSSIESSKSGFSQNGVTLMFDGDYYFQNRMALSMKFHFGMASMNKSMVSKRLDYFVGDSLLNDDQRFLNEIGFWQWSSPMFGFKYNMPLIINKIYIEAGVFSGVCFTQVPNQDLTIIDEVNKLEIYSVNLGDWSSSLPIMTDLSLRYKMGKNIQMKFSAAYFQAEAKYKNSTFVLKDGSVSIDRVIKETNLEVPINTLNYSFSLIYNIK